MAKFAADKTQIYLTATGAAAETPTVITGITSANPAVVSPQGDAEVGAMVLIKGTGNPKLDGKYFEVMALDGVLGFEINVDTTGDAPATQGEFEVYTIAGTPADLMHVCLVNLVLETGDPPTIDVGDLCGPGSLLGTAPPPTFSYSGWADPESPGFKNWVEAALESPKQDRTLLMVFPGDNGYIVGPAAIGSFSTGASTGEAVGISGNGTFTEMPTFSWVL